MVIKNKSALKRIRVAKRNRIQNQFYKSSVKTLTKKILMLLSNSNNSSPEITDINFHVAKAYSQIDKATKIGVFHKNTAARKKSLIARAIKNNY
uniref:ribosomal protein S20 n=1 Tax=Madagascaria erythrocladioides TaxID=753684 RepID=UPI001BEFF0D9|nr:ribosomal protein S20 [Madagascaria erythrocladioides]QUE28983.1 ribosomal protein S20 [Madagascaria erythrocladioides]UNJ16534.1 ribosomal protein S20 [Madagascaria erythrocladioides]